MHFINAAIMSKKKYPSNFEYLSVVISEGENFTKLGRGIRLIKVRSEQRLSDQVDKRAT